MKRLVIAFASVLTSFTLIAAATPPAFAAGGPAYRLTPITAIAAASTVIVDDTVWKCRESGCTAAKSTSRPAIVCAKAVKEVGKISAFSAKGVDFTEAELAKCNEKAR